jgi:hypothetical protein
LKLDCGIPSFFSVYRFLILLPLMMSIAYAIPVEKLEEASQKEPKKLENPDDTDHQMTTLNIFELTSSEKENEQDYDIISKRIYDKAFKGQNDIDVLAKKGKGNSGKLNHQTDNQMITLTRYDITSTKKENEPDYDIISKRIDEKTYEGQNEIDELAKKGKGNAGKLNSNYVIVVMTVLVIIFRN